MNTKTLISIASGTRYNTFPAKYKWIEQFYPNYIQNTTINKFYILLNNGYLFNDPCHRTHNQTLPPYSWENDMNQTIKNIIEECNNNEEVNRIMTEFVKEFGV